MQTRDFVAYKARFQSHYCRFLKRFNVKEENAGEQWGFLFKQYSGDNRYYHSLKHIVLMLDMLENLRKVRESIDPKDDLVIELGVWYHDSYYNPRATNNELISGQMASRHTVQFGLGKDVACLVEKAIWATTHREPPEDFASQTLCDLDLSSFASPWHEFSASNTDVRREYGEDFPEDVFRKGICSFFSEVLLKRPRIYQTPFFYPRLEEPARNNLARFIQENTA